MDNLNLVRSVTGSAHSVSGGMPTIPSGKQPFVEQKISDPSSSFPNGERYPIPSSFEYRFSGRETE